MHAVPMFRTYGKEDMCGAPANLESTPEGFIDPGYIYDAVSNKHLLPTCLCCFETLNTRHGIPTHTHARAWKKLSL